GKLASFRAGSPGSRHGSASRSQEERPPPREARPPCLGLARFLHPRHAHRVHRYSCRRVDRLEFLEIVAGHPLGFACLFCLSVLPVVSGSRAAMSAMQALLECAELAITGIAETRTDEAAV